MISLYTQRRLVIRKACAGDLPALADADAGHLGMLLERLGRQDDAKGVLLVATVDRRPVGHVYLWWEPADEEELRVLRPGVPLLMNLWVHQAWRGRGIGTVLTRAAEAGLFRRGFRRIALGIDPGNVDASRLYLRLDYHPWEHLDLKTHFDEFHEDGTHVVRWETCAVLEKELTTAAVPARVTLPHGTRHRSVAVRIVRRRRPARSRHASPEAHAAMTR